MAIKFYEITVTAKEYELLKKAMTALDNISKRDYSDIIDTIDRAVIRWMPEDNDTTT